MASTTFNKPISTEIQAINDQIANIAYVPSTEEVCGKWGNSTLYRCAFSGKKTTDGWASVCEVNPVAYNVKRAEFYCLSSDGYNLCVPYYVSASDQFRAAIQASGSKSYLNAQLGTSYPAHGGEGATITAVLYYIK